MVVNVELQSLGVLDVLKERRQRFSLGRITGTLATVVLGTRIRRGARSVPFVRPVPVDVMAETAASRSCLAILAPHAVACLGELEA